MDKVKAIHTTSGTVSGFTQPRVLSAGDEDVFFDQEARGRWMLVVRPDDIVQVLTNFDCCHRGYSNLGTTYLFLNAGRGNLDQQIKLAMSLGVTVLEHLPSLILRYFERAREMGFYLKQSRLRLVSGVGEGWTKAYKRRMEEQYGLPFRTLYGSVEAGGVVRVIPRLAHRIRYYKVLGHHPPSRLKSLLVEEVKALPGVFREPVAHTLLGGPGT